MVESLKIYVDAYQLFYKIDELICLLPKSRRIIVGGRMLDLASDILQYIYAANESVNSIE